MGASADESLLAVADAVNTLGRFCGPRDVSALTSDAVQAVTGSPADVFIFFGGSILGGIESLVAALTARIAPVTMIVGGEGHTTAALRSVTKQYYPDLRLEARDEASLFAAILRAEYGLEPDLLERTSRNCGENVSNALAVLRDEGVRHRNIVIAQDATMQKRMAAVFALQTGEVEHVVNFASYQANVVVRAGTLKYAETPRGMWPIDRYAAMLLGEIQRLRDDANGYGPLGKGYIGHVDIPEEVEAACDLARRHFRSEGRAADARWATT